MADTAPDVELVNTPLVKSWAWWAFVWLTLCLFVGIPASVQFLNLQLQPIALIHVTLSLLGCRTLMPQVNLA